MAGLPLKLIVGLGNPGRKYARTRHNAGWWLIDALLAQHRGAWRQESAQHAEVARVHIDDAELWLAKPTVYMNRSGEAVSALAHFYRIAPQEILIVHDDIDLPPGVVRLKQAGGHGGHNGLRAIIARLGAAFWRPRLGVGQPGAKALVLDSALEPPTGAEQPLIDEAVQRGLAAVPELLRDGAQKTMHRLHSENREPPPA